MNGTLTAVLPASGSRRLTTEALLLQARFPPRAPVATWRATCADRHAVVARLLAPPVTEDHPSRRFGLLRMLDWLQAQPGQTWQERWKSSGADTGGRADPDWKSAPVTWLKQTGRTAASTATLPGALGSGLYLLVCGDVVRPSISWLLTVRTLNLAAAMARARDPGGFAALKDASRGSVVSTLTVQDALTRIAYIMAAKGGTIRDITVGDCLDLLDRAFEYGQYGTGGKGSYFYQLLHAIGVFPEAAPATVRMFSIMYPGQATVDQLIDRYDLACRPVRDLLVNYLRARQPALDYTTLTRLASHLGLVFWKDLEQHHPGIDSLDLDPGVAAAWKQRARTRPDRSPGTGGTAGRLPRSDLASLLRAVRGFYLDIARWAAEDPTQWGRWAARCPIRASDIPGGKEATRRKSRMDQRTRQRLPAVPAIAAALDEARQDAARLLTAGRHAGHGEQFTAVGQTMRRMIPPRANQRIWAEDAAGSRHDLIREEDNAFWAWAAVEVLRETGLRVEELTELSHHSLVQYRLPDTGELIPMLHVAPSKTDQERLLVISPELADVLASILQRIRQTDGTVPLVVAYDRDRVWNPLLPLLFQHRVGAEDRPIAPAGISRLIRLAVARAGLTDVSGNPLDFTPHDFRRIFATEAIRNGMPPHIAQLLLGHRDINVTMGYKAVYPQEALNAHRAFIARRRALRPGEEYRSPTQEEWEEFLGHFQRRRVALGDCGRAYGTNCIHEHSCIRCPLLRVDPAQQQRLEDIRVNLAARIAEAERAGWLGEAEGLTVSLAAADDKLTQLNALAARRADPVHLGLPAYRDIAARTATLPQER